MRSMTTCRRGDIVLVAFAFSDMSGMKVRPVLVVSSGDYLKGRQEAIVAAVTSNTRRLLTGDSRILRWKEAGLLFPSVVTGVLRTVKQSMIRRRLGALHAADAQVVDRSLRRALAL